MKITNEIKSWLESLKNNSSETSYEVTVADTVIEMVETLEVKINKTKQTLIAARAYNKSLGLLDIKPDSDGFIEPSAALAQDLDKLLKEFEKGK